MAGEPTPEENERNSIDRRHQLNLEATVYNHQLSELHWQDPDSGESYEALCGFDVGLLAGLGGFVHKGEAYSLMLMHSDVDTSAPRGPSKNDPENLPEVAADSITVTKGNPDAPLGIAPVMVIRDIILGERSRLISYQAARRKHQQAAANWEKAHPVPPRDETFWFKPHRGSRYLSSPNPEAAGR